MFEIVVHLADSSQSTKHNFHSLRCFNSPQILCCSLPLSLSLLLVRCELLAVKCVNWNEPKVKLFSSFPSPFTRFTSGSSRRRYQQTVPTPNTRNSLVAVNKTFLYTFAPCVEWQSPCIYNVHQPEPICVCRTQTRCFFYRRLSK